MSEQKTPERAVFPITRKTLNVRPQHLDRLDALAAERLVSRSHLVREALDRYLREEEGRASA